MIYWLVGGFVGALSVLVSIFIYGVRVGRRSALNEWQEAQLRDRERIQKASENADKIEKKTDKKEDAVRDHRDSISDVDRGMSGDDGWNSGK